MLKHQYSPGIALLIQLASILMVSLIAIYQPLFDWSIFEWSCIQGLLAGITSYYLRLPVWWILINLVFTPLIITTLAFSTSPLWFLLLFTCLALIYGKTYKTQVPLYLSSKNVSTVIATLLPEQQQFSFIDLGSGCGGLLSNLAHNHKNGEFYGIESAPLPFIISKIRNMVRTSRCKVFWGDFWQHDFSKYNIVYAYLSPVPMQSLWQKATREMRPGSLLISNTFVIPGIAPFKSIQLNDFSKSTLYLWKIS
ncbi:MAG: hypothetical protein E6Q62_09180 [Nitrosomonas sp.]|nr:MAG: hypothetical protein E6Q62_09180 [Nitrosomonas sp.]